MTDAAFPHAQPLRPRAIDSSSSSSSSLSSASWVVNPPTALLLVLWLAAGGLLFGQLGRAGVGRSQEARILETAREMIDAPFEQWMLPQVNGHPRMQKPPLAYWVTAWTYDLFDNTSQGIGRIPAALSAWLTLGLVGSIAMTIFGRRAAFFACLSLLGGFLFFRHARLAEADIMIMLLVTDGCWSMWRAMRARTKAMTILWFHLAALAMGLAAMVKGPPAMYPMLFLIAQCAIERRWRLLLTFVLSGALLTFAIIASPWFLYVWHQSTSGALVKDLRNSAEGGKGHWDWPHVYIFQLALGVAPWTGACIAALVLGLRRAQRDKRVRSVLVWFGVIFIPLCMWGNKQRHYLLPLLPPLMILTGWYVDRALRIARVSDARKISRGLRTIGLITLSACAVAALAVPIGGWRARGHIAAVDWLGAGSALGGVVASLLIVRRGGIGPGASVFAVVNCAVMYVAIVLWAPTLEPVTPSSIARDIRDRYPNASYVFVHREHLPLVYHLNQIIPIAKTESELNEVLKDRPNAIAIAVRTDSDAQAEHRVKRELFYDDGDGNFFMIGPVQQSSSSSSSPPAPTLTR